MLTGSPFEAEYQRLAPKQEDWPTLLRKVGELNANISEYPAEVIRALQPPVLIIIGDSDIVRPEHAVEFFRLLGGGVIGDLVGLPKSQLAILPGSTHVTSAYKADLLVPMVNSFLDS
jgi:pimeloyl-ACP methyl ester carboxylesterase